MSKQTISESLRDAIKSELANPEYESPIDDTVLLQVAKSIRTNSPQAYDLTNSTDQLVWIYSGGDLPSEK